MNAARTAGRALSEWTARPLLAALLALALAVAGNAATTGSARADSFVPIGDGWQTYTNARFGMRFDYPANVFTPHAPPENGDGQSFASTDATLKIFATHNVLNETPDSMKRDMIGMKDYETVTYSPSGDTWLALSGFRGSRIFYEKFFFRDGVISAFQLEFPQERKPFYAPIIERIEDSFRPGGSG